MEREKNKKFITEISRKLEEAYIDICKSHGLTIHQECKSYLDELVYSGVYKNVEAYFNKYDKICCAYIIRYIRSVSPSFYNQHRDFIKCHNKEYREIRNFLLKENLSMWLDWHEILDGVKY